MLCFSKDGYSKGNFKLRAKIKAQPIISKAEEYKGSVFSAKEKGQLSRELNKQIDAAELKLQIDAFTQTNHPRLHMLPCFEFEKDDVGGIALIDFRSGLELVESTLVTTNNRICKLNTPYIQEMRQRFLSYKGRVGVPGYSQKLREWLLSKN